ncbi:hypothetical protein NKH77_15520 [Streptomyces sp. M19]
MTLGADSIMAAANPDRSGRPGRSRRRPSNSARASASPSSAPS